MHAAAHVGCADAGDAGDAVDAGDAARVVQGAKASAPEKGVASSCLVERSWVAAGDEHVGHRERRPDDEAEAGTVVEVDNTWTEEDAGKEVDHRDSGAGHAATAKLPTRASSTVVYGRTWEGRGVEASELRPSFRKYLHL